MSCRGYKYRVKCDIFICTVNAFESSFIYPALMLSFALAELDWHFSAVRIHMDWTNVLLSASHDTH